MPENQLNIYENVSVAELNRLLDETPNIEDKFQLVQFYVLCHGVKGEPANTVTELVYAAKEKLLAATVKEKKDFLEKTGKPAKPTSFKAVPKGGYEANNDGAGFLKNPLFYMSNYAKMSSLAELPEDAPEDYVKLKNRCAELADELCHPYTQEQFKAMEKPGMVNRFAKSLSSKESGHEGTSLKDVLKCHKGGFFERAFNTTSNQYGNFKGALENFDNPDYPAYGDLDNLEAATIAYLQHKIPGYDPKNPIPTEEQIAKLDSTGKGRAILCTNVLMSIQEQRELQAADKIYRENPGFNMYADLDPEQFINRINEMHEHAAQQEEEEVKNENEIDDDDISVDGDDVNTGSN